MTRFVFAVLLVVLFASTRGGSCSGGLRNVTSSLAGSSQKGSDTRRRLCWQIRKSGF